MKRALARQINETPLSQHDRRAWLRGLAAAAISPGALGVASLVGAPGVASATLFLPPHAPLNNKYELMHCGETNIDVDGELMTNPAFKLNDVALTNAGEAHALAAAEALKARSPTMVVFSTWRSCQQAADLVASQLYVPRERMVPEFDLLDARGVGAYEGLDAVPSVRAMHEQFDATSRYARPPPTDDGTPSESVEDVQCRVRQCLAKLEAAHSGAHIVIIAPDLDVLTIMQAALAGLDMRSHYKLAAPFTKTGGLVSIGADGLAGAGWKPPAGVGLMKDEPLSVPSASSQLAAELAEDPERDPDAFDGKGYVDYVRDFEGRAAAENEAVEVRAEALRSKAAREAAKEEARRARADAEEHAVTARVAEQARARRAAEQQRVLVAQKRAAELAAANAASGSGRAASDALAEAPGFASVAALALGAAAVAGAGAPAAMSEEELAARKAAAEVKAAEVKAVARAEASERIHAKAKAWNALSVDEKRERAPEMIMPTASERDAAVNQKRLEERMAAAKLLPKPAGLDDSPNMLVPPSARGNRDGVADDAGAAADDADPFAVALSDPAWRGLGSEYASLPASALGAIEGAGDDAALSDAAWSDAAWSNYANEDDGHDIWASQLSSMLEDDGDGGRGLGDAGGGAGVDAASDALFDNLKPVLEDALRDEHRDAPPAAATGADAAAALVTGGADGADGEGGLAPADAVHERGPAAP